MKVFPLKVRGETASVYLTQGALVVRWEYLGERERVGAWRSPFAEAAQEGH